MSRKLWEMMQEICKKYGHSTAFQYIDGAEIKTVGYTNLLSDIQKGMKYYQEIPEKESEF